VFGSVADMDELPGASSGLSVDVLVFDGHQRGPELGGLIHWWKHRHPRSRAIAIDLEGNEPLVDWIASGLDGFVGAGAQLAELIDTVLDTVRGEVYCSPAIVTGVLERIQSAAAEGRTAAPAAELTLRETDILRLLSEGLSNKEIAARLGISLYTVKNHVHNLLDKMKVSYRRQAIRVAIEKGFLRPRSKLVETVGAWRMTVLR
jgi:DNA-binding NarL/FixJ family response regulator